MGQSQRGSAEVADPSATLSQARSMRPATTGGV